MPFVARWILILVGAISVAIAGCIIAFIVTFLAGEGTIHYNLHKPGCFHGRQFYGNAVTVFSLGKFEWHVHAYGCPASDQYDPSEYKS